MTDTQAQFPRASEVGPCFFSFMRAFEHGVGATLCCLGSTFMKFIRSWKMPPSSAAWIWTIGAIGAMVVALCSGIAFWLSMTSSIEREAIEDSKEQSLQAIISAKVIESSAADRQRAVRGSVLRGEIEPYSTQRLEMAIKDLETFARPIPEQLANVDRVVELVEEQEQLAQKVEELVRQGDYRSIARLISLGSGHEQMERIREAVDKVVAEEREWTNIQRRESAEVYRDLETYTYAIAFIGLMLVVLAGTAVAMSVRSVWLSRMKEIEASFLHQRNVEAERMMMAHSLLGAGTWEVTSSGDAMWSPEMFALYGLKIPEAPEKRPSADIIMGLIHPDDVDLCPWTSGEEAWQGETEAMFRILNKGAWRWISSRRYRKDSECGRAVGMDFDVSELVATREELESTKAALIAEERVRAAEEAIRQMQKMEALGQMTGGVAHDLNNMLTPVVGFVDLVRRRHKDDEKTSKLLGLALESADRAKVLVSKLLSFSRRQQMKSEIVDLDALVGGMKEFLEQSMTGSGVTVEIETSDGGAFVDVDRNQLETVLLNLAVNARDAMPDGGAVKVSVSTIISDGLSPDGLQSDLDVGNYVLLCVEDTGIGMDKETLRKAIEPFYTTKDVGKGTGLGLSMAYGMAGQSGGMLKLISEPGEGTRACIFLPQADKPAEDASENNDACVDEEVSRLKILLVDDDDAVRSSIAAMLVELGHSFVQASSGAEAIEAFGNEGPFDIIVTDQQMAGMTGRQALAEIRKNSSVPAVIVSGYSSPEDQTDLEMTVRLAKPFTPCELAAAMTKAMAAAQD